MNMSQLLSVNQVHDLQIFFHPFDFDIPLADHLVQLINHPFRCLAVFWGVSHLLHMTFLPRRCGLLGHPCFVNPAMESPPAFCARVKSFLQDAGPALGR